MTQLLILKRACDDAVARAIQALDRAGLRAARSFDLRQARAAHTDCTCPHHGTDLCDCQMVVLLVYGAAGGYPAGGYPAGQPATLVCHGRDGHTPS